MLSHGPLPMTGRLSSLFLLQTKGYKQGMTMNIMRLLQSEATSHSFQLLLTLSIMTLITYRMATDKYA